MRRPEDCHDMTQLRAEIDRIDTALVDLLSRRAGYIDRAVTLKSSAGLPARIDTRVAEVVAHVRARADAAGLDPELAEALWTRLIDWSIAREEHVLGKDDG